LPYADKVATKNNKDADYYRVIFDAQIRDEKKPADAGFFGT